MAIDDKLTGVLRGRRIRGTHIAGDTLKIRFGDGSIMSLRIGGPWSCAVMGVPVQAARQEGTTLYLEFENGKTMELHTAAPRSSLTVRDRINTVEYTN